MALDAFDSFRQELSAIRTALGGIAGKTVRDDDLRERIRTLCRIWITSVNPSLQRLTTQKKELLKLGAEIEALAALTSKFKHTIEYRKRINRAIELCNQVVLELPPAGAVLPTDNFAKRDGLFLEEIPDLPAALVPNALLGWRERMKAFLAKYPFDRSIFLMIRYRERNETLIKSIRRSAEKHAYNVILARDHSLTDDLYNPIACLLCCARGLAVFDEPEAGQVFNPNVAYELGMMHLLGRDCRVLKHSTLQVLHTDILMKLYAPYDNEASAVDHVGQWLQGGDSYE